MNRNKHLLARLLRGLRGDTLGFSLQRIFLSPFIRAINYHDVPPNQSDAFDRQIIFYKTNFECVDAKGLVAFQRGEWKSDRPGLILTFDDGLRSHADVVAPLLDRHGISGWFMVPVGFIDAMPDAQVLYAADHQIGHAQHNYGDPRIAMTWDNIRQLSKRHEIGCHTWTHRRLATELEEDDLRREIPLAKERLCSELGRDISSFAWVGGEEWSYSRKAAQFIRDAGFQMSFMCNSQVIRPGSDLLHLQRTNVEARDPDSIVRLQLSGVIDLIYGPKRRRVNKITEVFV